MTDSRVRPLLGVKRIYAEDAALALPHGQEVVGPWPDAEIVPVASHRQIPELHGDERNVSRWVRIETRRSCSVRRSHRRPGRTAARRT